MLSLGRLFAEDYADGSLEQLVLAPEPLVLVVIGKVVAHWLVSGLPLVLISPVIALQFDLPRDAIVTLLLALLLGTPLLSLIGAIGAALTVGVRGGGVLISLLVLPLYVPVLIFGAGAVDASAIGMDASGHLSILGALLLLGMVLAPWATSAALRISLE
jgi:heme exporter protein B